MSPSTALAVFTRDLRLHDNPVLHAAAGRADQVVPLFVFDHAILASDYHRPNRARFLLQSLADLDAALGRRGAALVVRSGDWVDHVVAVAREVGAASVQVAGDVSSYARRRLQRLAERLPAGVELTVHPDALFAVAPGQLRPSGGGADHMAVFTAYFRRWSAQPLRPVLPAPRRVVLPGSLSRGRLPAAAAFGTGPVSPQLPAGGETAARRRLQAWLREGVGGYDQAHDDLAADSTSRLSPYLHLGCLSAVELVHLAAEQPGAGPAAFVRQVAWRDFYAQLLAARPDLTVADYRPRGDRWRRSPAELAAWKAGRTGYPLVDAGMRQLAREGWMHNRARLVVANFLCKTLYLDWRDGARHFTDLLVDADVASNTLNWQWAAGTGTDSRWNRVYNVTSQARRHDPRGHYVRRYVEELAEVEQVYVHEPWLLPDQQRASLGYPPPLVDPDRSLDRLRAARGRPR